MIEAERLRELAAWYRAFAERAGNPVIWDCRLRMAEDLEAEARARQRAAAWRCDGMSAGSQRSDRPKPSDEPIELDQGACRRPDKECKP
jgi:hypothetical protein